MKRVLDLFTPTKRRLILGSGATGLSCARFLRRHGIDFDIADSRSELPNIDQIHDQFPNASVYCGDFDVHRLSQYDELIVSPGVALAHPAIQQAIDAGVSITGDIDVFAKVCQKPIIAITGSNGKSTVTTLVEALFKAAGKHAVAGGNLGIPALDLLEQDVDIYILELSSFQLETTHQLNAQVATILNISPDHMDRYEDLAGYIAAKQKIFIGSQHQVINLDETDWHPDLGQVAQQQSISFALSDPADFSVADDMIQQRGQTLLAVEKLALAGQHNVSNVLAALALCEAAGLDLQSLLPALLPALAEYQGLPHRCQKVAVKEGVTFIDDSKGTNVGSTIAAVTGLAPTISGRLWLLAGGVSKGQDFSPLIETCQQSVHQTLLFGEDAPQLADALNATGKCPQYHSLVELMTDLVPQLSSGDLVLFSPACASFDQYKNYIERGLHFQQLVGALS